MSETLYQSEYKAELVRLLSVADRDALAICHAWDDNFGQPGWGGTDYVASQIAKATTAANVLHDALAARDSVIAEKDERLRVAQSKLDRAKEREEQAEAKLAAAMADAELAANWIEFWRPDETMVPKGLLKEWNDTSALLERIRAARGAGDERSGDGKA